MPVYRNIPIDKMDELRDVSVQAERVYLRLAAGRFSTRTGIVKYNARDLAAEARLRPSELEAALAELAQAGHLLRADSAPAVYLLGFCSAFAPRPLDNRRSWLVEIGGCKYANLAAQAMKEIEDAMATGGPVPTHRVPTGGPVPPLQEQDQKQDQKQDQEQNRTLATGAAKRPKTDTPASKSKPVKAVFQEPTEADTHALVCALVPTLQPYRQERIAAACFSYWQSAGWKRRGGPIKDWPATVRTWVTNQADRDKDVSIALAYKPATPKALEPPPVEKAWPFYAIDGTGLDAPEFISEKFGATGMTRQQYDDLQASFPWNKGK